MTKIAADFMSLTSANLNQTQHLKTTAPERGQSSRWGAGGECIKNNLFKRRFPWISVK